jgi:hypothetical protein
MYGRAKAMLGLVKVAKYGTGKFARANAAKTLPPGRGAPVAIATRTGKRGRPVDGASKSGQVRELLKTGMSPAEIAKKVGCTIGLVYNVKSSSGRAGNRGPGRPRKSAAITRLDGLSGILDAVRNSERERTQMRVALERIQAVLADVLG